MTAPLLLLPSPEHGAVLVGMREQLMAESNKRSSDAVDCESA
jgi:hypothetical protein